MTLEVIYYDANGSEIGAGSDTVRHLEPGAAKNFGHNVPPDGLRGVANTTDVIPRPYIGEGDK